MGTSRNDRSPDSPSWKPALLALGKLNVPPERQLQEVWRAALAHSGSTLETQLRSELFPIACGLVSSKLEPTDALSKFDYAAQTAGESSFFLDLARRSLLRASGAGWDVQRFAADVFGEIGSYYVSRDIPSFIGARSRVQTPLEALALKSTLKKITTATAMRAASIREDGRNWNAYVSNVLRSLSNVGNKTE